MALSRGSTPLTSQVKAVLLCSSFGQTLSQEAQQAGVSLGTASHGAHVTKGLLLLADTPVLDHWLSAASKCSRLQPLASNVLVVSNADDHQQLQAWAISAGLPDTAVISNGATASEPRRGAVADVALAVKQCSLQGSHLLVVDCDYALEPGFSLSRVVEAAIVRGKDIVMHITPFEGADLGQQTTMDLAAPGTCTTGSLTSFTSTGGSISSAASGGSCVITLNAAATGPADGCTAALAPVCVLHRSSIPTLLEAANASTSSNGPGWRCMGAFLQQRVESGTAVYSLPLDYHFSVRTLEDYQLTSAFFGHLLKLRAALGREVQGADLDAAIARQQPKEQQALLGSTVGKLTAKLHTLGAAQAASGGAPAGVRALFMEWYVQQQQQQQAQQGRAAATTRDMKVVPPRFQDAGAWNHKAKQEHACYNTSNNAYGLKKPTAFDMPLVWSGAKGLFTETFHGGCYRSMGLSTAVARSKVHRDLDEL